MKKNRDYKCVDWESEWDFVEEEDVVYEEEDKWRIRPRIMKNKTKTYYITVFFVDNEEKKFFLHQR